MRGEFAKFVLAAQFLTRLPLRTDRLFTPERMAEAPRYFALVGLLIGFVCAGVYWLAALLLPHLVAIDLPDADGDQNFRALGPFGIADGLAQGINARCGLIVHFQDRSPCRAGSLLPPARHPL